MVAATKWNSSHAHARLVGTGLPRVCLSSCMYSSSLSSGRFRPWCSSFCAISTCECRPALAPTLAWAQLVAKQHNDLASQLIKMLQHPSVEVRGAARYYARVLPASPEHTTPATRHGSGAKRTPACSKPPLKSLQSGWLEAVRWVTSELSRPRSMLTPAYLASNIDAFPCVARVLKNATKHLDRPADIVAA
jgi:hypothetical protein